MVRFAGHDTKEARAAEVSRELGIAVRAMNSEWRRRRKAWPEAKAEIVASLAQWEARPDAGLVVASKPRPKPTPKPVPVTVTSKHKTLKGVFLLSNGEFSARIGIGPGQTRPIGTYATDVEAAKAYDRVAVGLGRARCQLNYREDYAALKAELEGGTASPAVATETGPKPRAKCRPAEQPVALPAPGSYHGVRRLKGGLYAARLVLPGHKMVQIGSFADEVEAARAYDSESVRRGRGKSSLNFPVDYAVYASLARNPSK